MAWSGSNSHMFVQWVNQPMLRNPGQTAPTGGTGEITTNDAVKCALYNNTPTPSSTVAVANSGYNTDQWVTANEVTGGTDWVAGGRTLASKTMTVTTNVVTFTAANLTSAATATLSTYGCLIYDNTITGGTVAKQGICFLDFGGVQTVTAGTFSLTWSASGIFTVTV